MHKRCQKNVANNCGINARQLADILNDMGMRPDQLTKSSKTQSAQAKKKVLNLCGWTLECAGNSDFFFDF